MSKFKERRCLIAPITPTVVDDVTVLATAQTTSTFTMTPTRVDTATAGSATGAITADANDATMATNIQTAIRALLGIYADATVTAGTTDTWIITVFGGYDVTWATTATSPTITESGAAGGTTAVPGSCTYTGSIPIGRFGIVKRLRLAGFNDNSLDIALTDVGGGTGYRTVFSTTALDTSTASADTPYDQWLTLDGVDGSDGAAVASTVAGFFEGPLKVVATTSAPVVARSLVPAVSVFVDTGMGGSLKLRSTGVFTGATATVNLGAPVVKVRRLWIKATSDTSVAISVADALSKTFYVKTATNYTTAADVCVTNNGVDQGKNAVNDMVSMVVKSPVTVTLTGHDGTGFQVDFYVET